MKNETLENLILRQINKKKRTNKKEVYKLLYNLALEKDESIEKRDLIEALSFFFQTPKSKKNIEDQALSMFRKNNRSKKKKIGNCESYKQFIVESSLAYCTDLRSALRWKTDLKDGFYCTKTHLPQQKIEGTVSLNSIKQVLKIDQRVLLHVEDFKEKIIDQEIFYSHTEFELRDLVNLFPKEVFDIICKINQDCFMEEERSILHASNRNYAFVTVSMHK